MSKNGNNLYINLYLTVISWKEGLCKPLVQLLNKESVSPSPSSQLWLSNLPHAESSIWIFSYRLLFFWKLLSGIVKSTWLVLNFQFLDFRSILCNTITSAFPKIFKRTDQLKFNRVNQNQVGIFVISTHLRLTAVGDNWSRHPARLVHDLGCSLWGSKEIVYQCWIWSMANEIALI